MWQEIGLENLLTDDYKTDIGNAITHKVGKYALDAGYNGIIAPSARADGGVNIIYLILILFNNGGVGMSSIMELYNAYNDDLWKIYANSFKEVSEKIGNLDKIPQDILNVLVGLLGLEEANVWIKTEIKELDNNIILDLIKTEVGIKALKMFLLSMPI